MPYLGIEFRLIEVFLFGEKSLRAAVQNFERNHQGMGNCLIRPEAEHLTNTRTVQRRERLGGMLKY